MSAQLLIPKGLSQKLCLKQWRRMLLNIYSSPILLQYLVGYIYLLVNWYNITILAKLLSMQTPSLRYKGSIPCSQHKDCSSLTQVRVQRFDWNFMTFWVHFWWSSLAIFRGKKTPLFLQVPDHEGRVKIGTSSVLILDMASHIFYSWVFCSV